jgi:PKD repeat protein
VKIYKSRLNSELVSIGSAGSMVRYQNPNSATPSCSIFSIVIDNADNFSPVSSSLVNIDWTVPTNVTINDGLGIDINVFVTPNEISANWTSSIDPNSDVISYSFAVGTISGSQDVASFTNVGLSTIFTLTGLSLVYGQMYYITIKAIDGAGLESLLISSDGQLLQLPTTPPIANFYIDQLTVCEGDSVLLNNTSIDGVSFSWSATNGTINNPISQQAYLIPSASGPCFVTLIATNSAGSNQSDQTYNFTVLSGPIASALPDLTNLELPNAIVLFNNTSQNADSYYWDFGDGDFSIDQNPWHEYTSIGTFTVMLIATRTGCQNDTTYFIINVGQAFVDENGSQHDIEVYPNPFHQSFTMVGSKLEDVILYDLQGKIIFQKILYSQKKFIFQFENVLDQGMYLIKVKDNGRFYTKRLIKL